MMARPHEAMLAEMARRLRRATAIIGEHVARNAVRETEERLSFGERLADRVTLANGSWGFVLALLARTGAWIGANGRASEPLDPCPFAFFNLLLGIALTLQGPLIMMSQTRQARKDRAQAAADYDVNLNLDALDPREVMTAPPARQPP